MDKRRNFKKTDKKELVKYKKGPKKLESDKNDDKISSDPLPMEVGDAEHSPIGLKKKLTGAERQQKYRDKQMNYKIKYEEKCKEQEETQLKLKSALERLSLKSERLAFYKDQAEMYQKILYGRMNPEDSEK